MGKTGGCNREPRVVKPVLNQECRELGTGSWWGVDTSAWALGAGQLMRARGENLMGEGIALNTVWVLEGGRGAKLCCC